MSERNKRSNYMKQSGIKGIAAWTILLMFVIKIIYISYQTGMNGVSFYACGDILFVLFYVLFGVSVIGIEKKLIYFQFNHGNYRNAMKVYHVVTGLLLVLATIVAVALLFAAPKLSVMLFHTKLCALQMQIMAIAIWVWIMMFSLKGYMEGIGNPMPGIYADLLAFFISLLVTILTQPLFAEYGKMVSALMRQDAYIYAYASCSGALGLAIGGLFGMLFLVLVRTVFGKEIRRRVRSDEGHKTDSAQDILWNFLLNYIKNVSFEHIVVLLAVVLFVLYTHMDGLAQGGAGVMYVGMVVLVLPLAFVTWQISVPFTRQLAGIMKQSDYHHAKERMSFYLKLVSYTILPSVATGYVLAPLLADVLFDIEQPALAGMIRIGMISAVFIVPGIFFRQMLSILAKPYVRYLCVALFAASGIVFRLVLMWAGRSPEESTAYAFVLANLLLFCLTGVLVLKKIRIYNRLFECVGIPFVGAVLAAAVAFGMYVIFGQKLPPIGVLLISVLAAYLVFELVMVVLRVFEAHEWREVPASAFPVALAKLIGRYEK